MSSQPSARRLVLTGLAAAAVAGAARQVLAQTVYSNGGSVSIRGGRISGDGLKGNGIPGQQVRPLPLQVSSVILSGTGNLRIRIGRTPSATIRVDENLLSNIATSVSGNVLTIAARRSFATMSRVDIEVVLPHLRSVSVSGTGKVSFDEIAEPSFAVHVSGTGSVFGSGAADRLSIDVSDSGDVNLAGLRAKEVRVVSSGASDAAAYASDYAYVRASGAAGVNIAGNPARRDFRASNSSEVRFD